MTILEAVKADLRITHTKLDDSLLETIDECISDLQRNGICHPSLEDPNVRRAVKMYSRWHYTADPDSAGKYQVMYESLLGSLQGAEGYGLNG